MNNEQREKYYKKAQRIVDNWLKHANRENYLEEPIQSITKQKSDFDKEPESSCALIGLDIGMLFFYHGVQASYYLIHNDDRFIGELVKSYSYLKLRVKAERVFFYSRGYMSTGGLMPSDLFHYLMLAIVLDDKDGLSLGYDLCEKLFESSVFVERECLEVAYAYYAMALACIYKEDEASLLIDFHPSYSQLFELWNSADSNKDLADAIKLALDYHLVSAFDEKQHSKEQKQLYPEFVFASAFLKDHVIAFPIEIVAYYKLRNRRGLDTPVVDHPLMSHDILQRIPSKIDFDYDDEIVRSINGLFDILEAKGTVVN